MSTRLIRSRCSIRMLRRQAFRCECDARLVVGTESSVVFKHLSSSAAASLTVLVFTAIGGVVSARWLLPAGKGELTAVILWPTVLVAISGLGLTEAVTYYSARNRARSAEFLSTALVLAISTA